jgi:2-polyprenyl-3-methyl-5-hydroxy-6-metoxy-1,4-benzoquinol methylase
MGPSGNYCYIRPARELPSSFVCVDQAWEIWGTMNYYHWVRREIKPLLPNNPSRVLEVGAGAGGTLKWIKALNPKAETTAVEINPALLHELRQNVDVPIIGPIDEALPQLKSYDLILLLDVLEHVADPTATLRNLAKLLEKGGQIIVSVPNIAHLSVSVPLLLKRRFNYQDAGILDRTHLKFFVEETAVKLLNDANFVVIGGLISGMQGSRSKLLDLLSLGVLRHHLAKQYIMLGQLTDGKFSQERIRWAIA